MPALLAAEANGAKEKAENDVEASAGQGLWPQPEPALWDGVSQGGLGSSGHAPEEPRVRLEVS